MVRAERFSIALMVGALSIAAGHRLAAQEQPPPPQQPDFAGGSSRVWGSFVVRRAVQARRLARLNSFLSLPLRDPPRPPR